MTTQHDLSRNDETEDEMDRLDANLLEIEILYKSRCVKAPNNSNVVVREIAKTEE